MTSPLPQLIIPSIPQLNMQSILDNLLDKKKQCQTLVKIMQEWKSIQSSYSKKMSELAETLHKLSCEKKQSGKTHTSKEIFENLWYLSNIVSIQSRNLALKIDDDIITEAKETIKKITVDFSNPAQLQKSWKKNLGSKRKVIEQTYGVLIERKKVLEDATTNKFITEQCMDSNLEKRMKATKKLAEEEGEFRLIEFKMKEIVNDYNNELGVWETESTEAMRTIKEVQNCYSKVIFDVYIKAQLHRGTQYKTILHEIDRVGDKNVEMSVREGDIQAEESRKWHKLQMQDFDSFLLKSVKMIDDKTIDELTIYSKNKDIKEAIRGSKVLQETLDPTKEPEMRKRSESESSNPAKYYQNLSKFFIECLQGQPTQQQLQKLNKLLVQDQRRRVDFVSIFQKYRIEGKCQMRSSKRRAKKILEMFLDTCLKMKDGFCCRLLMVLLFTYFFILREESGASSPSLNGSLLQIGKDSSQELVKDLSNKSSRQNSKEFEIGKDIVEEQIINSFQSSDVKREQRSFKESQKVYLQVLVQDHPIWKRLDYWQSVLIEGIYQEMVGHRRGSRGSLNHDTLDNTQQQAQTLRNIVFSQLLAISCNMKHFGCCQKQIIWFISKFGKLFGLGSQRMKQIERSLVPFGNQCVPGRIDLQQMLRD